MKDIIASNGVIHVIKSVILPKSAKTAADEIKERNGQKFLGKSYLLLKLLLTSFDSSICEIDCSSCICFLFGIYFLANQLCAHSRLCIVQYLQGEEVRNEVVRQCAISVQSVLHCGRWLPQPFSSSVPLFVHR